MGVDDQKLSEQIEAVARYTSVLFLYFCAQGFISIACAVIVTQKAYSSLTYEKTSSFIIININLSVSLLTKYLQQLWLKHQLLQNSRYTPLKLSCLVLCKGNANAFLQWQMLFRKCLESTVFSVRSSFKILVIWLWRHQFYLSFYDNSYVGRNINWQNQITLLSLVGRASYRLTLFIIIILPSMIRF